MTNGIIDTHTHLFTEEFDADREEVIARAHEAGVEHLFMPNIDEQSVDALFAICNAHPDCCHPMMGLHPTSVQADFEPQLLTIHNSLLAHRNQVVAIGEIGVDLYWDQTYKNEQIAVFARQVEWAVELDLPIVIHCRNAFSEIYDVLRPYKHTSLRGIFHSFTGNPNEARQMLEFDHFMIGVNGIVTFKKSELAKTLPSVPLDRVVLETDSPYLAPVPKRGQRNESSFIVYILEKVAQIYGLDVRDVSLRTKSNAFRLFGVS